MNARDAVHEMLGRFGARASELEHSDDFVAANYDELRASGMLAAAVPYLPWLRLVVGAVVVADARRVGIARYATGLGTRDIVWFAVAALWPIVALPWYLTVRGCVRAGLTPVRVRDPS